jgi:hypothetical protein
LIQPPPLPNSGRTKFYNSYGAVRDILQNHLTEVLTLAAMEVPSSTTPEAILDSKLQFLQQVQGVNRSHVLLGQYEEYANHVREDYKRESKRILSPALTLTHAETMNTHTATFAAASLKVDSAAWADVPFVLVTGKQVVSRMPHSQNRSKSILDSPDGRATSLCALCLQALDWRSVHEHGCGLWPARAALPHSRQRLGAQRDMDRQHLFAGAHLPARLAEQWLGTIPAHHLLSRLGGRRLAVYTMLTLPIADESVGALDAYTALVAKLHAERRWVWGHNQGFTSACLSNPIPPTQH